MSTPQKPTGKGAAFSNTEASAIEALVKKAMG